MRIKSLLFTVIAGLFLLGCTEKEPTYPWISDLDTKVEANGKIVGYEIYAKW